MWQKLSAVVFSLVLLSPTAGAEQYLWTLSASTTDPFANTAEPDPTSPFVEVQLWLACSSDGMASAEFNVEVTSGFLSLIAWTPCCGFLQDQATSCPLFAVGGCPSGPARAGWFTLLDFTGQGGSLCIVPCKISGRNHTVDCGVNPQLHPNAWIGFSSDGTPSCFSGTCGTISVNGTSWGRLKSSYR